MLTTIEFDGSRRVTRHALAVALSGLLLTAGGGCFSISDGMHDDDSLRNAGAGGAGGMVASGGGAGGAGNGVDAGSVGPVGVGGSSAGAGGRLGGSGVAGNQTGAGALHDYGSGDHGITLSDPNPGIYCWIIEETVRISGTSHSTSAYNICLDNERNCLAHEPADSTQETSTSYLRVSYQIVGDGNGPLTGSCAMLDAYWRGSPDVECLYHAHCGPAPGGRCLDWKCVCPAGVACGRAAQVTPGTSGAGGSGPGGDMPGTGGAGNGGPMAGGAGGTTATTGVGGATSMMSIGGSTGATGSGGSTGSGSSGAGGAPAMPPVPPSPPGAPAPAP